MELNKDLKSSVLLMSGRTHLDVLFFLGRFLPSINKL